MREILFRGKGLSDNEWYTGMLVSLDIESDGNIDDPQQYTHCIVPTNVALYRGELGDFDFVNPETVGQYIGLRDRDGKKIFEGDILESPVKRVDQKYGHMIGIKDIRECKFAALYVAEYRVIGNVYDNPELLGVKE